MPQNSELNSQLLLVTGKGGVGKSTTSLALAQYFLGQGKKVLLVCLQPQSIVQSLYGLSEPISYEPQNLEPNFSALTLNPQDAIREYVLRQIRFEFLYRAVFENRVVKYFLRATPGLSDLVYLGKIWDLQEQAKRSRSGYDHIIVDMAASGHGFNMLKTPQTVMTMVQSGPLFALAEKMDLMVKNPKICSHVLVTLAEELPMNESLELMGNLKETLGIQFASVVVNRVLGFETLPASVLNTPTEASSLLGKALRAARFFESRQKIQRLQIEKMKSLFPILLPQIFSETFSRATIATLATSLGEQLQSKVRTEEGGQQAR